MTILIMGDTEASGPCPGKGDLAMFGLVVIEPGFTRRFESGLMRAECEQYNPSAYMFGVTREQHVNAPVTIAERMEAMRDWLHSLGSKNGRYVLVTDNPGFDFAWLNYESHHKLGEGMFGHSARRIGDVYAGLKGDPRNTSGWRKYRMAPHDHNPANDALGNAEAWEAIWRLHGPTAKARQGGAA